MSGLLERLRRVEPEGGNEHATRYYRNPDGPEAAAEIERLQARVRELEAALTDNAAHLAAAISLLERGGKAAKKAAASDKMFDIMLNDYHKSLERARAALAALPAPPEEADDSASYNRQEAEVWASGHWDDES